MGELGQAGQGADGEQQAGARQYGVQAVTPSTRDITAPASAPPHEK